MEMTPVEKSSTVVSAGFDPNTNMLRVEFRGGELYQWFKVDPKDYEAFWVSPSKGSFLHSVIEKKYGKGVKLSLQVRGDKPAGYLIETPTITSNNPIKGSDSPSKCPSCGKEAKGFIPPVHDQRYNNLLNIYKETYEIQEQAELHKKYLKTQGGYIEICTSCKVSFFVPYRNAKILSPEEHTSE